MSITLYGIGPSRSFRCLWALEEAHQDYQFRSLEMGSTANNGTQSDTYLAINPQGKVPSLQHGDFFLTESAAIINYVASLSNEPLIPSQAQLRAKYDEISFFVLTELEQPLWTTGKHKFAIPKEHRVPDILATAKWEFEKALNALDKLITIEEYALGDSFTFADILLAHTFNWAEHFSFNVPPQYLAYRDRMYQRDAALNAIKKFS